MGLVDQILEYDRARRAGEDAAVPATGGRRVVCVACTELVAASPGVAARFGLDADQVLVLGVPGARVPRADGDLARAVALAAGAAGGTLGGTLGGADVLVLGHEGCAFRAPTFAVPGPPPQGESFSTVGDLVRAAVTNLRASPWMARTNVSALLVDGAGRLEAVRVDASAAAAVGSLGGPAGSLAPSGPVSFFGAPGAAPSLATSPPPFAAPPPSLGAPPPLAAAASPRGDTVGSFGSLPFSALGGAAGPLPLSAPGAVQWDAPSPIAPSSPSPSSGFAGAPGRAAPAAGGAGGRNLSSLGAPDLLGTPESGPSAPVVIPMPAPLPPPPVGAQPVATISPVIEFEIADVDMLSRAEGQMIDAPAPGRSPPPAPPAPRPAPAEHTSRSGQRSTHAPSPPPPARPGAPADDPFKRAEEILERLRREKRR